MHIGILTYLRLVIVICPIGIKILFMISGTKYYNYYQLVKYGFSLIDNKQTFLGGEASVWAENIDTSNVFTKIFPRLHAIAFKLWNPKLQSSMPIPLNNSVTYIMQKLHEWTCRVHDRGLPRNRFHSFLKTHFKWSSKRHLEM